MMKIVLFTASLLLSVITVCNSAPGGIVANVATAKRTWQSSTYMDLGTVALVAGLAVDQDTNYVLGNGDVGYHCSHTNSELNAWWVVDLGAVQTINSVRLTPRYPFLPRLADFVVGVSNLSPEQRAPKVGSYPVCATFNGAPTKQEPITLTCKGAPTGRYIVVQLLNTNYLEICELEVFSSGAIPN